MKTLLLGVVAAFAVSSFAWADAPPTVKMTDQQLDQVVAGWFPNCSEKAAWVCGNNGWGNGTDPINPGSFKGATAPSKSTNGTIEPGINKINTNPTTSSGR
jgi:hypothetical protein